MADTRTIDDAYRAASEAVLAVRHDAPGVLLVRGADRLDLLHRMSTNGLESLAAGDQRQTVFTDPVGRTIDVVSVLQEADRAVLIGLPGRAGRLREWLQKHIFFQDQVTLEEPEHDWSLWGLYGPHAVEVLPELGAQRPTPEHFFGLDQAYVWPVAAPVGGYLVLTASAEVDQQLAKHDGGPVDRAAYEALRIEAGLPAPEREILQDSIPLEIGLRPAIDFSKGCYVGQEIIARMDSRGRLAKQLVGLRFSERVEPQSALQHDGRTVGTVTSVARSPSQGWIGIGSVRTTAIQQASLQVAGTDLLAEVVELAVAAR